MSFSKRAKTALDLSSTLVLTAASAALLWNLVRAAPPASTTPSRPRTEQVSGVRIDGGKVRNRLGESKFAIVEFSDFECPFCRQFARTTYPQIRRELIDTGQATYVTFALPLERIHPNARNASEAAACAAAQMRYWDMHERLFALDAITPPGLLDIARSIGLDEGRFERCLSGEASQRVTADVDEARRLDIKGTPTFFLGTIGDDGTITPRTRFNGPAPFEDFARALKDLAAAGTPTS
jgi:protein-disulfide isomerase